MEQIKVIECECANVRYYRFELNLNNHPISAGISVERSEISPNKGLMRIEYTIDYAHKNHLNCLELAYIVRSVFEKENLYELKVKIAKPTPLTFRFDKLDLNDSIGYYEAILKQICFSAED